MVEKSPIVFPSDLPLTIIGVEEILSLGLVENKRSVFFCRLLIFYMI